MSAFRKVTVLSFIMFLSLSINNSAIAFFPYLSYQSHVPLISPLMTATFFLTSMAGFLTITTKIKSWSFGKIMFIGTLSCPLYVLNGLFLSQMQNFQNKIYVCVAILTIVGVSGFLTTLMYFGQCTYVSLVAEGGQSSSLYGVSWMIIQSANLAGNLLNQYLSINHNSYQIFYFGTIAGIFVSIFTFFIEDVPKQQEIHSSSFKDSLDLSKFSLSFKQFIPFFITTGLCISYTFGYVSVLGENFISSQDQLTRNRLIFLILVAQGIGQILGGFLIYKIGGLIPNCIQALLVSFLLVFSYFLVLFSEAIKSYLLYCLAVCLVGICDCCFQSVSLAIADEYRVQKTAQREMIFYNAVMNISVAMGFLLNMSCQRDFKMLVGCHIAMASLTVVRILKII